VGARAHEPPYAHQAGKGTIKKGMVLAIEPGIYWPGGGGLRLEDNFLITDEGNEKLCSYPVISGWQSVTENGQLCPNQTKVKLRDSTQNW
jgi:Xaa-Pro aminopeptidase